MTSKDLKQFSAPPKRLLSWEMGTIDVFLRQAEGKYWAIIKDETYPTLDWVTGKTISHRQLRQVARPVREPERADQPELP